MGRMVILGILGALACTSVHMVQRDGCWLKHTETAFGGSRDELGFCSRQQPEWAQDRLERLVQECMAQADYRWENRAIAAWSRAEPVPAQENDAETTKACMGQATQAMGMEAENAQLKTRLADLAQDRDALKGVAEKDREFLEASSDKMVTALGEAAKKPAPSATATATSTGTAKTESDQRAAAPPQAPVVTVVGAPAAVRSPAAVSARSCPTKLAQAKRPACDQLSAGP